MGILSDRQIAREMKDRIKPFSEGQVSKGVISYGLTSYGYDMTLGHKFKVFSNVWGSVVDPKRLDPKTFVDVDITPGRGHKWPRYCVNTTKCETCGKYYLDCDFAGHPPEKCRVQPPDHIIIPPNSFALGETVEWFDIPRDVLAVCVGKSTYARCGIIVNVTPLEPEWRGKVTIEISNTTPLPARVYAGEGVAQLLFFRSDERMEAVLDALAHHGHFGREWVENIVKKASCDKSYAQKSKAKYQDQKGLTLPKVED